MTHPTPPLDHPLLLCRTLLHRGAWRRMALVDRRGERLSVTPFERETPSTVYIERPVRLDATAGAPSALAFLTYAD